MNIRFTILLMWTLLSACQCLVAQVLSAERHIPYFRDSIEVYKMQNVAVGDSGRNCIWDYSTLPVDSAEIIHLDFYASSPIDTMHIGLHREHAHYHMLYHMDTLWQMGYETSNTQMHYSSPLPILRYPFVYGDTLVSIMSGTGQYCHRVSLSIEGNTNVRADGIGRLILPNMIVDSVLRVSSSVQYVAQLHRHIHILDERYQWYATRCRYPLLEIVKTRTISNVDTTYFASTYYFPQEIENHRSQEEERHIDVIENADSLITSVTYLPNPVYTDLNIHYTLMRDAQVYISLHYNGGIIMYQTSKRKEESGDHSILINMSGMPLGNYVVYIHADDSIVSGDIIKY